MLLDAIATDAPTYGDLRRAATFRLGEINHRLHRASRFFAELSENAAGKPSRPNLHRIRARVDGVALLLGDAATAFKVLGIDKKTPSVMFGGRLVTIQDASRRVRAIQAELKETGGGDSQAGSLSLLTSIRCPDGRECWVVRQPPLTRDVPIPGPSNDEDARRLVSLKSCDELRAMPDYELIITINVLLDGPTTDADERAILKILECLDNARRAHIAKSVGVKKLLSDIDGSEWDRLVILLVKCGVLTFAAMDDDASRLFVNSHACPQLGALDIAIVHQLVLNMFAGGTGDDDEQVILKLLSCQSTARVHQLVGLPGTAVGDFDWEFDGDEWDDLEALFAAHGITLA